MSRFFKHVDVGVQVNSWNMGPIFFVQEARGSAVDVVVEFAFKERLFESVIIEAEDGEAARDKALHDQIKDRNRRGACADHTYGCDRGIGACDVAEGDVRFNQFEAAIKIFLACAAEHIGRDIDAIDDFKASEL